MKNKTGLWICALLICACATEERTEKEAILKADREAPLGWISEYLQRPHV